MPLAQAAHRRMLTPADLRFARTRGPPAAGVNMAPRWRRERSKGPASPPENAGLKSLQSARREPHPASLRAFAPTNPRRIASTPVSPSATAPLYSRNSPASKNAP